MEYQSRFIFDPTKITTFTKTPGTKIGSLVIDLKEEVSDKVGSLIVNKRCELSIKNYPNIQQLLSLLTKTKPEVIRIHVSESLILQNNECVTKLELYLTQDVDEIVLENFPRIKDNNVIHYSTGYRVNRLRLVDIGKLKRVNISASIGKIYFQNTLVKKTKNTRFIIACNTIEEIEQGSEIQKVKVSTLKGPLKVEEICIVADNLDGIPPDALNVNILKINVTSEILESVDMTRFDLSNVTTFVWRSKLVPILRDDSLPKNISWTSRFFPDIALPTMFQLRYIFIICPTNKLEVVKQQVLDNVVLFSGAITRNTCNIYIRYHGKGFQCNGITLTIDELHEALDYYNATHGRNIKSAAKV